MPEAVNTRCPRCGGDFHCGAHDASCACAQVQLDDETRAELQLRFKGCLCNACLCALQTARDLGSA